MAIFDERKIDCHAHVTDPARFPYGADIPYHPSGQEIGTAAQLAQMMQTYGIRRTLLVQPNSGYGSDNACMLDAIAQGGGAIKGVAIVGLDASLEALRSLQRRGIVGVAFNPTLLGTGFYERAAGLVERLAELDMLLNIQVEQDQLNAFMPWIERIPVTVLVDHCGRPTPGAGPGQPGFRSLLRLADTGRVYVKLSGYAKFARTAYPFEDCWPYVRALVEAFTLERCLWASDWPYLRAHERQDVGPLVRLVERLFPGPADREALLWETPQRLLRFPPPTPAAAPDPAGGNAYRPIGE